MVVVVWEGKHSQWVKCYKLLDCWGKGYSGQGRMLEIMGGGGGGVGEGLWIGGGCRKEV